MILDVRTMYIAVGATCFIVASALFTLQARRFRRDGELRQKAETQLRESEERYRVAIEHSNDGVALFRGPGLIYGNQRFLDMFGHGSLEEARHTDRFLAVHPDDREMVAEYTARRLRGEPAPSPYECKGIAKNGTTMNLEVSVASVVYLGESASLAYIRDITERKEMEEALRESETKLRAIFDGSRDAIEVSKEGVYFFVNPAYVFLFGYESADELIGTPILDSIAPVSRGLIEERMKKLARGETVPPSFEATALKKDGTMFLAEATVSAYVLQGERFTLVILRDITDRRQAEDEVRMLKHSIDVHYDGVYWMNTDNEFVYVNEAACKAVGYERAELIGRTVYQVNPMATAEGMRGVWEGLRKGGPFLGESVHRRKDGSEFPVEIVTTYVRFGGKEFACGFARDISEKKKLEDQLRQAQKMEAVGTLAGGVAHDFNNILTVIMGLANLIQMSIDKDDVLRPYVDQIVASSERAADLTRSLLAFSRKQRITLEPHKVNGVVTSTAKLLKRLLPEDIDLTMNLADEDTVSLLDVTQIGQVLMNLATNARDAMPHGGSLTITTERATLDENFTKTHGFGRSGRVCETLRVGYRHRYGRADHGTYLRALLHHERSRQRDGPRTRERLRHREAARRLHHRFEPPFNGTTFDIYLPLIDPPSQQEAPAAEEVKGGTETVLIVEDDPDVRNMLTTILESQGYATIEAIDGDDAIRLYRRAQGRGGSHHP